MLFRKWYSFLSRCIRLRPDSKSGRTLFGAAFASFKKYAAHFLNSACGGTEPNEAPPKVLVKNRAINFSIYLNFGTLHIEYLSVPVLGALFGSVMPKA